MDISPIKSRNIWAHITDKEPGIISMPLADDNFSSWGAGSAYIDTINVQTTSTDWDLYVYNKYKYSTNTDDINNVTKVASNLSGNQILHPNLIYNNDTEDQITLLYVSNSGNETCSLYVKGELREKNIDTDRTSYWNQKRTSTYTANLAKSYFEYLPRNMYIIAENLSSTVYMLPRETDAASWHGKCAFISTIKISTASKDYDIYLYENEDYDDNSITTMKIAENLSMDNEIELNSQYKSMANFVYLKIVDNDGTNTFNLYISGESREIQDAPVGQKQKIIIDYSKVANTDQEDFPVLIKISQADNPVFLYADDNGENIYFSSIDNTLEYPAEIEIFSKTEKLLIAWVKVPVVSASSNTEFYMHYLNSTRKRESNPEDVWDSNFAGVWHLNDETTSSVLDSTSNDNDMGKIATNEPIETDGKILKAQQFDQSNDRIYKHYSTPDSLTMTTAFTLSAWIYPFTTENTATQYIIMRNSSSTTAAQYSLHRNNGTTTVGRISAYVHGTAKDLGTSDLPVNNWYHVVVTFSKPTLNSYINGAYLGTGSYDSPVVGSGDFINIGGRSNSSLGDVGAFVFHGNIDEARVSNIARSADWIATEYNNQNDPDSFYSIIIE